MKLTDSGRQVYRRRRNYARCDVAVPKPNDFQDELLRRDVFYPLTQGVGDFVRFYLGSKPAITKDLCD